MSKRSQIVSVARATGYTLVEITLAVAVAMGALALGLPAFQSWIQRVRVEGYGVGVSSLVQLARMRAISEGVEALVVLDEPNGEIYAFLDRSGPAAGSPPDRAFTEGGGGPPGEADVLLARRLLPGGVSFTAPQGESVIDGFTAIGSDRIAILTPAGDVVDAGAYRYGDAWGNYLEVRVAPASTARTELRKFRPQPRAWCSREGPCGPWEWYWGKGRSGG